MHRWLCTLALVGCGNVEDPGPEPPDLDLGTLRDGCVLMHHMDEVLWTGANGDVVDACGDNRGTPTGGITTVAGGVRGRAGSFSGTGCVEVPDSASLRPGTALTMSAWVLPTALNGSDAYGVISKRIDMADQSAYNMFLWIENHAWVDLEGQDDRFPGGAVLTNNTWSQITVVFDGSRPAAQRVRTYVNSNFDLAAAETAASLTPFTSPLHIGCMPSPSEQTQQNFIGLMDEVAIWNRALTDAEITRWFTLTKPLGL